MCAHSKKEKTIRPSVKNSYAFCLFMCAYAHMYVTLYERIFGLVKPRSHLAESPFRLFTIEINPAIAENLKPIGMMKMQCVTIYPNIYECVSDYMKIHHDRFWTFYVGFTIEIFLIYPHAIVHQAQCIWLLSQEPLSLKISYTTYILNILYSHLFILKQINMCWWYTISRHFIRRRRYFHMPALYHVTLTRAFFHE